MVANRIHVVCLPVLLLAVSLAGCTAPTPPPSNGGVDFGDGGDDTTDTGDGNRTGDGPNNQTGDDDDDTGDDDNETEVPRFTLLPPTIAVTDAGGNATNSAGEMEDLVFNATFSDVGIAEHIVNYVWRMGDGNVKNGSVVHHAYLFPGRMVVNLTVEDAFGRNASSEITIGIRYSETFTGSLTVVYVNGDAAEDGRSFRQHRFNVSEGAASAILRLTYTSGLAAVENLDLYLFAPNQTDSPAAMSEEGATQPESITLDSEDLIVAGEYAAEVRLRAGAAISYTLSVTVEYV